MQVKTRHTYNQQLRELLHIIAATRETEPCISLILQMAAQLVGAAGAAFLSTGDPVTVIAVGETADYGLNLETLAKVKSAKVDPKTGALICPVRAGDQFWGALSLTVAAGHRTGKAERDLLAALVDGLAIVMTRAHEQAETDKVKQLVRASLMSISDPLLVFDENWRLVMANAAAALVFREEPGLNTTLRESIASEELVAFAEGTAPLAEWVSGDKTFVPNIQPILDHQPMGWILALHDVSQYKKLYRSQNEFIRIVSHDIRSPLTSMRGFADMMSMVGELNDLQVKYIDKVQSGIVRITALIDNIQDAGRFDPDSGFYVMTRTPCDLRAIITPIVNNYLIPAEKQELTLAMSVDDDVPIINGDTIMLERAITNLVDNAIKYTPNGGEIDVLVSVQAGSVIVSVRDNGHGISAEDQARLFQRHVRLARKEHKPVAGSGLGLFIIKSVALHHGGDAWVESEVGVGSTFSFNVPLKGANLVIAD